MPVRCLLYYITDRTTFAPDEPTRRRRLLKKISEATHAGLDYIQLREKDLSTRDLESLARDAVHVIREAQELSTANRQPVTALLINSRSDIALTVGADGVHLRSDDISPSDVRIIRSRGAGAPARELSPRSALISVSCHSPQQVNQAARGQADLAIFGPVFEKKDVLGATPAGISALRRACEAKLPVFALGGVTIENAQSCLEAGADGIAGIRLFQENNIAEVVRKLRNY